MNYTFNSNIAKEIGVNNAIFLNKFKDMVVLDASNDENGLSTNVSIIKSSSDLMREFKFWSSLEIRNILNDLINKGLIKETKCNVIDGCLVYFWYSLTDKCVELLNN